MRLYAFGSRFSVCCVWPCFFFVGEREMYAPDDSRALDYRSLNCFEVRSALLVSLSLVCIKNPLSLGSICSTSAYNMSLHECTENSPWCLHTSSFSVQWLWRECNELDSCILLTALISQHVMPPAEKLRLMKHK
jgi:hypothetical protein